MDSLIQFEVAYCGSDVCHVQSHSAHTVVHNEDTKSLQSRDNDDEMSLVVDIQRIPGVCNSYSRSLKNLVTKDLATDEIKNSLLCTWELGQEQLLTFIQGRMIVREQRDKPE